MPAPAGRETEYIEERDREMTARHVAQCTFFGCPVCELARKEADSGIILRDVHSVP